MHFNAVMSSAQGLCRSFSKAYLIILLMVLTHCRGQSNGDLRLNNDEPVLLSSMPEGRLEIYLNSEWGTVCDDNFRYAEATVACRQLGFTNAITYGAAKRLGFQDGGDEVLIHLDQVNCTGKEDAIHLLSCIDNVDVDHDCLHTEDIALKCNSTLLSNVDPFDGRIRLTGGDYSSEGLIEVFCNQQWGTICDDQFSVVEANTICLQLGYTHAEAFNHLINIVGNDSQSIWLDDVQCITTGEQCISMCQKCPGKQMHNCMHFEDVTIKCSFNLAMTTGSNNIGYQTCNIKYSSTISSEIIAVIVVSIIFASICFSLCSACISLFVCWKRRTKPTDNDDTMSNATEMTRSTISTQPIPPPRPSDLPQLSTPTNSAFSPSLFSPFSPFDVSQPLPPPRPQHLGSLTTPTKPFNPLLSPFPMPQSIYESTPVYIAPGNTGRPIYVDPSKMNGQLPPSYPNCINHYERTPTGTLLVGQTQTDSSVVYESIPPLVYNTYTDTTNLELTDNKTIAAASFKISEVVVEEDEYEKLRSPIEEMKEVCYDNLEPSVNPHVSCSDDEVQHAQSSKITKTLDELDLSGKELVNPYVNLKEVQSDKISSNYDSLQPATQVDESHYNNPTSLEEMDNKEVIETLEVEVDPHYENTLKTSKLYCNIEEATGN